MERAKKRANVDVSYPQALGLAGFGTGSSTVSVDVKDGKIVRLRPFDFEEYVDDFEALYPWSVDSNGHKFGANKRLTVSPLTLVYKNKLYDPRRVPFPMKRVDWEPGGDPEKRNAQNRGISKYERISWDEALDIVAGEISRVVDTYNPFAILCQSDGHGEEKVVHASHGCPPQMMMKVYDGFTYQTRNPDSWEGWYWGGKMLWGETHTGVPGNEGTLWELAHDVEMLVYLGGDAESTALAYNGQFMSEFSYWLDDIDVQQVYLTPDCNYAVAIHGDRWIPVYPNTDAALFLGIIYQWLQEDSWDQEYMETHTTGFDWLRYHIMGGDDGVVKDLKWAEGKCGVPSRIIKALARQWARKRTSIITYLGGSSIRAAYSSEPARLAGCLLALQGWGKPGRNFIRFGCWNAQNLDEESAAPRPKYMAEPSAAYQGLFSPPREVYDIRRQLIPKTLIPEALLGDWTLENPLRFNGTGLLDAPIADQVVEYQYPTAASGGQRVKMVWSDTPCWTTCWNNGNRYIDAVRQDEIEFVLVQHPWLSGDACFADVILPVALKPELRDIASDHQNCNFAMLLLEEKCIEPITESKSDWEICVEISKRLGAYEKYMEGMTEEKLIKLGFEEAWKSEDATWEDFSERKVWVSPNDEDSWPPKTCGYRKFYEDPEANPMPTPSGKLEIYSSLVAAFFPEDKERGPYPRWIEETEGCQERLGSERAKEYPFLLVSNHPRWRHHANLDECAWLRECETAKITGPDGYQYEPVWLNPIDAAELGIETGDVVKVFNERGWVLGGAYVTERVNRHTALQDHGARPDVIEPGISDRGGANNLIAPSKTAMTNTVAENTSGFLVGVEKVDLAEMKRQYPEAFSRPYNQGQGVALEHWLA
ncbi:MAG: molybdopterin dinucleotide binding domain-containing protein [Coriobacteriia bacterium]